MTGPIPTELGKLTSVEILDMRKLINALFYLILFMLTYSELIYICEGDYKVTETISTELGKADYIVGPGTIPTELGNLRSWKYVVFGKKVFIIA